MNLKQFQKKISNMIDKSDDLTEEIIKEVAIVVVAKAKTEVPVDTGNLRNSISQEKEKDSIIVGTNVEYASAVEFGTSKSAAQPFMKPAKEAGIKASSRIIKEVSRNYVRS